MLQLVNQSVNTLVTRLNKAIQDRIDLQPPPENRYLCGYVIKSDEISSLSGLKETVSSWYRPERR